MPIFGFLPLLGSATAGILGCAFGYANLPTSLTLGAMTPTVKYLSEGQLTLIEPGKNPLEATSVKAEDLFAAHMPMLIYVIRRPGCTFCRSEASRISEEFGPKLREKNVSVIGVVHETLGAEEFRPFLKDAELYYDVKKHFYGPQERWLPMWMGVLRIGTYLNLFSTKKTEGNLVGEGRLLGGVYLLDKDQQMVFSHLEKEWGDKVDSKQLSEALDKLA